jgi:hypothetical protein
VRACVRVAPLPPNTSALFACSCEGVRVLRDQGRVPVPLRVRNSTRAAAKVITQNNAASTDDSHSLILRVCAVRQGIRSGVGGGAGAPAGPGMQWEYFDANNPPPWMTPPGNIGLV